VATQKVPLTRIDPTGASEGKVLKYSSGALAWGDDNNSGGGGGGGDGTAFKNTILGTESVSANSLEQYQVHSGLEILSGGSFTISLSGDLVLDAPDDPHKAAGWTDSGNVIHTTDSLNKVVIGQTTALSADDMLSVTGGNVTVAGSISAQGNVYGNNVGKVLQVVTVDSPEFLKTTATTMATLGLSATLTPVASNSTFHISLKGYLGWTNETAQGNGINAQFQFYRSNTTLQDVKNFYRYVSTTSGTATYRSSNPIQIDIIDTPNTGSEITYHVDLAESGGSNHIGWCTAPWSSGHVGVSGQLVVMEIAQ